VAANGAIAINAIVTPTKTDRRQIPPGTEQTVSMNYPFPPLSWRPLPRIPSMLPLQYKYKYVLIDTGWKRFLGRDQ